MLVGCSSADERLAEFARQANEQQARQNEQMAQQNKAAAEASQQLIDANAQARQEFLGLQEDLQVQQAEIGAQRDALEADRKDVARQRQRDPLIAAAVTGAGVLLATLAPLLLCWYVLGGLRRPASDDALVELLVTEFTVDSPVLLPPPDKASALAQLSADGRDDDRE